MYFAVLLKQLSLKGAHKNIIGPIPAPHTLSHTPFCAQSEVELADGFQCVSLLSSVSCASQQLDLVLAVDDTLGLVWTLTPIQMAQVSGCSELAWQ